jgi:hypothetical protein
MEVQSGDLIHADRHGAVVVPVESIDAMAAALDGLMKREAEIIAALFNACLVFAMDITAFSASCRLPGSFFVRRDTSTQVLPRAVSGWSGPTFRQPLETRSNALHGDIPRNVVAALKLFNACLVFAMDITAQVAGCPGVFSCVEILAPKCYRARGVRNLPAQTMSARNKSSDEADSAPRVRLYRERRRQGLRLFTVAVPEAIVQTAAAVYWPRKIAPSRGQ